MDWVVVVLGSIVGSEIYLWIKNKTKYKYHWKCPECNHFRIDANDQSIIDRVKANHTHETLA